MNIEREFSFWTNFDRYRMRPIDIAVPQVRPEQVVDFTAGSKAAFSIVRQRDPDIIFIPERGAGPVSWMISEWEAFSDTHFDRAHLLIGTHTDVLSGTQGGYNSSTKRQIIDTQVALLLARREGEPVTRPMIIDEVQSGRTLSTAVRHLHDALQRIHGCENLSVISMLDTNSQPKKKNGMYRDIVANEVAGINSSVVTMPLFYVDKPVLLNYILEPKDAPADKVPNMLHLMHNQKAERFFRNLVVCYARPQSLGIALRAIRSGKDIRSMPIRKKDIQPATRLYDWIMDMCTEPEEFRYKVASDEITRWFTELYKLAIAANP